jgi:ribonuclease HI
MCEQQTAKAMIEELLALRPEQQSLIACTLWRSWICRNKINAQEKAWGGDELLAQINYWTSESKLYYQKENSKASRKEMQKWSAPEHDYIKFNTDGAFFSEPNQGGWGFIARDSQGLFRGAGAGKMPAVTSAAQAEAFACIQALQAAADWGLMKLILETDSTNMVRAIETKEFDRVPEGVLYRDIKVFIQLNFQFVHVVSCRRNCNKVAHDLANAGARGAEPCRLWLDDVPEDVMMLVASESAMPMS